VQPAAGQQPLERVLTSGNESFDDRRRVRLDALGQYVRLPHERLQPRERRGESFGVVGPHHAAAARKRDRFQDTGIGQWLMADG
jgi:hypothetical protein